MNRLPSDRHVFVHVWSSPTGWHWCARVGKVAAEGVCDERSEAWACAASAMRGALAIRRMSDALTQRHGDAWTG